MNKFLLLTTVCLCAALCTEAQPRRFRPQTFTTETPMVHDPVMAYEDSIYHIYATGMGISTWYPLPQSSTGRRLPTA